MKSILLAALCIGAILLGGFVYKTFDKKDVKIHRTYQRVMTVTVSGEVMRLGDCVPVDVDFTVTPDTIILKTTGMLTLGFKPFDVRPTDGAVWLDAYRADSSKVSFARTYEKGKPKDKAHEYLIMVQREGILVFSPTTECPKFETQVNR